MEFIFVFIITPLLATLLFYDTYVLLTKIKNNKNPHNQVVLGCVLTFLFVVALLYSVYAIIFGSI